MPETDVNDEQRYRPQSRTASFAALATFGLAGMFGLSGHSSMAVGLAVLAGAWLAWAAFYFVMYRV